MNVPESIQRNVSMDAVGQNRMPWERKERRQDNDEFAPLVPADEEPADMPPDPEQPAQEAQSNRLNEIATIVRALTYGEMMELAAGFWLAKPEGEMTPEAMAPTLHKWSQKQK